MATEAIPAGEDVRTGLPVSDDLCRYEFILKKIQTCCRVYLLVQVRKPLFSCCLTVPNYACLLSDLYSFYKEFKAGETDNYVSQFAVIHGQTPLEAFKTIAENVLAMDRRVKDILGDGPERQAWESFTAGYAEFHLHTPRYCLKDLLPEFYSFA